MKHRFVRRSLPVFSGALFPLLLGISSLQASAPLLVTPQADGEHVPVRAEVSISEGESIAMHGPGGVKVPGQIVAEADGKTAIYWILPKAEAGKAQKWRGVLTEKAPGADKKFSFRFGGPVAGGAGEADHVDLLFGDRAVKRLQIAHEEEPPGGAKHKIWKVYSKVYDKAGQEFITKGAGGRFPHHRGIYLGWSKTGFQGKRHDTWHMTGPYQELKKITGVVEGPVLGRCTAVIEWKTKEGVVILEEQRTLTVYRQPDDTIMLMDLSTELKAVTDEVELAGDPEHAGCQYRPSNEVAKNKSAKYLFPSDEITKGNVNKTKDMPWAALTYQIGDQSYEVQHMSHPDIPEGNVYSAYRDYGRFGSYFKTKVAKGETLGLQYRFRVAEGELADRAVYAHRYDSFAKPPAVKLDVGK